MVESRLHLYLAVHISLCGTVMYACAEISGMWEEGTQLCAHNIMYNVHTMWELSRCTPTLDSKIVHAKLSGIHTPLVVAHWESILASHVP